MSTFYYLSFIFIIRNLYLHGSRAWGTSEETKSDWDFILVLKGMDSQDNTRLYTEFMDVNVVILTQASFQVNNRYTTKAKQREKKRKE